jgi:hypothetical protein
MESRAKKSIVKKSQDVNLSAKETQAEVKLNLQSWIKKGTVVEELKRILTATSTKDETKLKAIEMAFKYAGFEDISKIAQTDSVGNDIVKSVNFDELKSLWMNELKTGKSKSLDDDIEYLEKLDDKKINQIVEQNDLNLVID